MGMNRLTALIIANNPTVKVSAGGPAKNGKYVGWITLGEEDHFRPLLNSDAIYETVEIAEEEMQKVITNTKAYIKKGLHNQDPITHVMSEAGIGPQEIDVVKQVVSAARAHKEEAKDG